MVFGFNSDENIFNLYFVSNKNIILWKNKIKNIMKNHDSFKELYIFDG